MAFLELQPPPPLAKDDGSHAAATAQWPPDDSLLDGVPSDAQVAQLLVETEELLRAVNASEEAHMSSEQASSSSNESTTDQTTSSFGPRRVRGSQGRREGKTRNVTRERMKAEIATLRQQAADLERLLHETQTRRQAMDPDSYVWKEIAARQQRARESAEAQNALMKRTLDARAKYLMEIEEAMFRLQQIVRQPPPPLLFDDANPYLLMKPLAHKTVRLEPGDDTLFETMLTQLDSAYSRLAPMLHSPCAHAVGSASTPFANPQAKRETDKINGQIRSFVEMSGVEVMPFDLDLLARVSWACSKRKSDTWNCMVYESERLGDDVVAVKARVRRVYNSSEVYLHILCVSKQFVVKDRVVTAWLAMIKGADGFFPDSYVQETGCTVSMRSAFPVSQGQGSASPKTVKKTVVQFEPKRFSISPPLAQVPLFLQADADVLTHLLVASYADDSRDVNEMMENMLLDEVAKRPR